MFFVFWQNIISPHQAPFLRALADLGHKVTVVSTESMTPDRLALGWKTPDLGNAHVVVGPNTIEINQVVQDAPAEAIHVMAGARWNPLGDQALQQCLASKRRMGILTEAPDPRGMAGLGRWAKYTIERVTKGGHYDFVLAMGGMGARWFRRCAYPERRVFPFAYVIESILPAHSKNSNEFIKLLFAGQFIHRKGLDILLRALASVPSEKAQSWLLGDGPEKEAFQIQVEQLGIQNRVVWLHKSDSVGVMTEMAKSDVTILPSRHDGWGAVVNESLMVGTPVICSNACGASDLIREPWLGTVFRSGSADDLAMALEHWIKLGTRTETERQRIRSWSNCITGESLAHYFVSIMNHTYSNSARPMAPWRMNSAIKENAQCTFC